MTDYRNRITGLEYVNSKDLTPHAGNWRNHGKAQTEALRGVLSEVGIAGALLAYRSERNGGKLTVIDGHLRKDAAPQTWPVLVLDVSDAEADYLLATHDPLAAMATADAAALDALLATVNSGDQAVQEMLAQLAAQSSIPTGDDWANTFDGLPTGDKLPFEQMTFTLATAQAETVREAIERAKAAGPFVETGNENSNGNALARICTAYVS